MVSYWDLYLARSMSVGVYTSNRIEASALEGFMQKVSATGENGIPGEKLDRLSIRAQLREGIHNDQRENHRMFGSLNDLDCK